MRNTKSFSKKLVSLVLAVLVIISMLSVGAVSVSAESETKTIYFSSNGYWSKLFAVYVWGDSYDNGRWYALNAVSGEDDLYKADIPEEFTNIVFCSRSIPAQTWDVVLNKTEELVIPDGYDYLTLAGTTTAIWSKYGEDSGESTVPAEDRAIYFVPNAEWMEIQYNLCHDYVLHAYNAQDTEGVWVNMELAEGSYGIYPTTWKAVVSGEYTTVEFCRVESDIDGEGYTLWEKTDSQTVPENSNMFTQNDDCATGTWSFTEDIEVTTPAATEPQATEATVPATEETGEPSEPEETKVIYFTPNATWTETINESIGKISAYAYSSDTNAGTWMWGSLTDDGSYAFSIDATYDTILFGVSYSDSADNLWAQTNEQLIPDNSNHFTQDAEDDLTGTWSFKSTSSGNYYYVVFVNPDGKLIEAQVVKEGEAAVAPENPEMAADAQYTYTFSAWDTDFSCITADTTVTALYTSTLNKYTVTFVDYDGKELYADSVDYGTAAEAPADPVRTGYTFTGWDKEFDNITSDITVTAQYSRNTEVTKTGKLRIEVAGGTRFTISVNGGAARPQGTSYLNTKTPIGATVTLVASTTNNNAFVGWMNEAGAVVSTSETYTFATTGSDYFKAMYITSVEGVNLVTFKNAKAANGNGQIIDMQYYAAGDEIVIPDGPTQAGYIFTGWDKTAEQITVAIANGEDVTVSAVWEVKKVYVAVNVTNGAVTANGGEENGKYLANRAVTVTADTAPSSKKFAYWTNENGSIKSFDAEYKFYPAVDTTLVAVYVAEDEEIVYQALADIAADPSVDGEKISYTLSWNVPTSVGTYKSSGLMVVNKEDFNADTFYHGTTDTKVFDRALSGTALKPQNTYSINKSSSYYDNTYVAATWVQYEVNGETVTIYSDFIEVTKLG